MDEDYARRLRAWLRAEPETAEPRWLREIPAPNETREHDPADRWSVQGQLPHAETTPDDEGDLAVVIPLPRPSRENGCRLSGPRPRTRPMSEAEARSRRNHPSNAGRREEAANPPSPMSDAEARSRWNHPSNAGRREEAANPPISEAEAHSRWSHPSNVGRRQEAAEPPMSEPEAHSRWSHPSNVDRREEAASPPSPMSQAEARSRWNHPANWHRRRRAAQQQPRDEPGSR